MIDTNPSIKIQSMKTLGNPIDNPIDTKIQQSIIDKYSQLGCIDNPDIYDGAYYKIISL